MHAALDIAKHKRISRLGGKLQTMKAEVESKLSAVCSVVIYPTGSKRPRYATAVDDAEAHCSYNPTASPSSVSPHPHRPTTPPSAVLQEMSPSIQVTRCMVTHCDGVIVLSVCR